MTPGQQRELQPGGEVVHRGRGKISTATKTSIIQHSSTDVPFGTPSWRRRSRALKLDGIPFDVVTNTRESVRLLDFCAVLPNAGGLE